MPFPVTPTMIIDSAPGQADIETPETTLYKNELTVNSTYAINKNMEQIFGQKLRKIRRLKGISQRDLASEVGVDFSYISKVENERLPPPSAETIEKICKVLDVPIEDLLLAARKPPTGVMKLMSSSPSAVQFFQNAKSMNLDEKEWRKLTKQLKKLRS